MLGNVLECSGRLQKVSWVVVVGDTKQLQCLLRSRPPESEIEIELERTWEASSVDLEMVWTRALEEWRTSVLLYILLFARSELYCTVSKYLLFIY